MQTTMISTLATELYLDKVPAILFPSFPDLIHYWVEILFMLHNFEFLWLSELSCMVIFVTRILHIIVIFVVLYLCLY
jgi:hypothetical protein